MLLLYVVLDWTTEEIDREEIDLTAIGLELMWLIDANVLPHRYNAGKQQIIAQVESEYDDLLRSDIDNRHSWNDWKLCTRRRFVFCRSVACTDHSFVRCSARRVNIDSFVFFLYGRFDAQWTTGMSHSGLLLSPYGTVFVRKLSAYKRYK